MGDLKAVQPFDAAEASEDVVPQRRVGIREVAEHAGVAIASVSRVISGHPDVSMRMRKRVHAAIDALGYRPDFLAQSLRTGSTMTIGIVVSDIRNPLMAHIVHAADARLREAGYISLVVSSLNDPQLETTHLDMLSQRRVDGVAIAITSEDNAETAKQLENSAAPVVLLDRDVPGLQKSWSVRFDHATAIQQAARHLMDLGHRRIALVNGYPGVRPSRERAAALALAATTHPDVVMDVRPGSFSAEHGHQATIELMSAPARPTAIISGSNQILIGVMKALRQLGLAMPDDVSLVTCDEVPMTSFLTPRLAIIRRDVELMGRLAADLMLEAIAGRPPRSITLPTTFEAAESCGGVPRRTT